MGLGYSIQLFGDGGGESPVVYVPAEQAAEWRKSFDANETVRLLDLAADAIRGGDGIEATRACLEAWARIALFHKER